MKSVFLVAAVFFTINSFSQSTAEAQVLRLSNNIFYWETENKTDSLENIFHEKFIVVGSDGNSQTKKQYIARLRDGSFIHDSIHVEENNAIVLSSTAIVIGKGLFMVTSSGNKLTLHLSYMEVFTKDNQNNKWKVLAMKANAINK